MMTTRRVVPLCEATGVMCRRGYCFWLHADDYGSYWQIHVIDGIAFTYGCEFMKEQELLDAVEGAL